MYIARQMEVPVMDFGKLLTGRTDLLRDDIHPHDGALNLYINLLLAFLDEWVQLTSSGSKKKGNASESFPGVRFYCQPQSSFRK